MPPELLALCRQASAPPSAVLAAALYRASEALVRAAHAIAAPTQTVAAGTPQAQVLLAEALVLVPTWCAAEVSAAVRTLPSLARRAWSQQEEDDDEPPPADRSQKALLRRLSYARFIAHWHSALARVHLVAVSSLADLIALLARQHAAAQVSSAPEVAMSQNADLQNAAHEATQDGHAWRVLEISPALASTSSPSHALPAAPQIIVVHSFDGILERALMSASSTSGGSTTAGVVSAMAWSSPACLSAAARVISLSTSALLRSDELWQALAAAAVQRCGENSASMAHAADAVPRSVLCLTLTTPASRAALQPTAPLACLFSRLGACVHDVDERGSEAPSGHKRSH